MEPVHILLTISFFLIAAIYSSVGFGGGSSYLALLAVAGVHFEIIRPAALLCNILVVTGGTIIYYREGKLDFSKSWPFVVASVPMAFLGGLWKLEGRSFFLILAVCLIFASLLLFFQPNAQEQRGTAYPGMNAVLGGGIGFLSGLVSIGGGIFLSPILNLLNWDEAKKIAALASFYILVNSISGLIGQLINNATIDWPFIFPLLLAVMVGGQVGSRLGVRKFNPMVIKRITAVLIMLAAIRILYDHL